MNTRSVALYSAVMLTGCVTSKPVALPSGEKGFAIRCDGTARDMSDCMNHAGQVCGGPYEVISGDESSPGNFAMPVGTGYMVTSAQHRTLIVRCGNAKTDEDYDAEVRAFLVDPRYPHARAVAKQMSELLNAGQAKDLQDAYRIAVERAGLN